MSLQETGCNAVTEPGQTKLLCFSNRVSLVVAYTTQLFPRNQLSYWPLVSKDPNLDGVSWK